MSERGLSWQFLRFGRAGRPLRGVDDMIEPRNHCVVVAEDQACGADASLRCREQATFTGNARANPVTRGDARVVIMDELPPVCDRPSRRRHKALQAGDVAGATIVRRGPESAPQSA